MSVQRTCLVAAVTDSDGSTHMVALYGTPEAFSASFTAAVVMLLAQHSLLRGLHLPATLHNCPCCIADRLSHS